MDNGQAANITFGAILRSPMTVLRLGNTLLHSGLILDDTKHSDRTLVLFQCLEHNLIGI